MTQNAFIPPPVFGNAITATKCTRNAFLHSLSLCIWNDWVISTTFDDNSEDILRRLTWARPGSAEFSLLSLVRLWNKMRSGRQDGGKMRNMPQYEDDMKVVDKEFMEKLRGMTRPWEKNSQLPYALFILTARWHLPKEIMDQPDISIVFTNNHEDQTRHSQTHTIHCSKQSQWFYGESFDPWVQIRVNLILSIAIALSSVKDHFRQMLRIMRNLSSSTLACPINSLVKK